MTINGDHQRQTENSGRSDAQTHTQTRQQPGAAWALAICTHCDGTGWTHHATKGLTKCKQTQGQPHATTHK